DGNNRLKQSFLSVGYQGLGYSYYHIGGKENMNKAYEYLSKALIMSEELYKNTGTSQSYFDTSLIYEKLTYYYLKKFDLISASRCFFKCIKFLLKSHPISFLKNGS
ncbi:MAG: hypothetical protein ACI4KR_02655, partial [Ruminiclostridium sp.]